MDTLAEVILGSPAADCAKFGICQVEMLPPEAWSAFKPRHLRHVKAILSRLNGGKILFRFPYDGMFPATGTLFFPPKGFLIETSKELPPDLVGRLGLLPGSATAPGLYPIDASHDGFAVEIVVSARLLLESSKQPVRSV